MRCPYPVRAVESPEFPAYYAVLDHAFNSSDPASDVIEHELLSFEFDRSSAAFDRDLIVGTACAYTFEMSVPGGTVPAGGISSVGVLPTYRRRGIMSAVMGHQLADIARRGEPVAALRASESEIYGRLGFGCASEELKMRIRRGEGRLIPSGGDGRAPRLRLADPGQIGAELRQIYGTLAASRPGVIIRNDRWWRVRLADPAWARDGASPQRWLLAEDDDGPRGYAAYNTIPRWGDDGSSSTELHVLDLVATDPDATAALWGDLFTRDLVSEVFTGRRPVDDPLLALLAGRRRARATLVDGLWIRLMDVPAALSRRRYAAGLDLVIEVTDDGLEANRGRWRLQAEAGAPASCDRTSQPADVTLPVQSLSAAYLGGTRLVALAEAGRVEEHRPGALAQLSAAMLWDPSPWCPLGF